MSDRPILETMVLGETGEVVIQVFDHHAVLTVRQRHEERLAEVKLTNPQAMSVSDALQRVPEPDPLEAA